MVFAPLTSTPPISIPPHLAKQTQGVPGPALLKAERDKASFDPEEMRRYLLGDEYIERMDKILPIVENEPKFDKTHLPYMGREAKFKYGLAKDKRMAQLHLEHKWTPEEAKLAEHLVDMPSTFRLHREMYLKTLREQTTDEQKELFTYPSERFEMIGCYAQTELAHGSNVQALETTATYQPSSKTFLLQSPSLTAMKWWAGGLGRSADHAIVMAQLFTPDGKDGALVRRGPFPFIVPLRDRKTRELLPGRVIMDIGPKFGLPMIDNGAMLLDKVEIPHVNFPARFSQVDPDTGKFTPAAHDKLAYGTMVFIRAGIVADARLVLARAATVAIRYCAIRRQFADRDAEDRDTETAVINYQSVQARIFPPLVQAFAFHFTGRAMYALYEQNQLNLAKGDFSLLADLHAMSCSLKSLSTIVTSNAIEECRRACGGHGFSVASGLVDLYSSYLPQVTWEGDSYMLPQQVAKYLFKTFRTLYSNPQAPMSKESRAADYIREYLANPDATAKIDSSADLKDPKLFVRAFGQRAAYLTGVALHKRDVQKRSWNSLLSDIHRMSTAHAQYYLVRNFSEALLDDPSLSSQPSLLTLLTTVFELFCTYTMDVEASEFLSSGYLQPKQHEIVRNRLQELLAEFRPDAVAAVDAWGIPDYSVNSALGNYDGNVYEGLLRFAQNEPLNKKRYNVDVNSDEIEVGVEKGTAAWEMLSKL